MIAGAGLNFGDEHSVNPIIGSDQAQYLLGFEQNSFGNFPPNYFQSPSTSSLFGVSTADNQYAQYDAYSSFGNTAYPQMLESQVYAPNFPESQPLQHLPHIMTLRYETQDALLLQGSGNCRLTSVTRVDDIVSIRELDGLPNESNMTLLSGASSSLNNWSSGLTLGSDVDSWPMSTQPEPASAEGQWNSAAYTASSAALDTWEQSMQNDPVYSYLPVTPIVAESSAAALEAQQRAHVNSRPRSKLGPSRPISLPPARKGGRKGPLKPQEKTNRKEVRKRGSCMRCRKLKEKVKTRSKYLTTDYNTESN